MFAALVVAAGCGGRGGSSAAPRAFCDAASRYETELEREATNGVLDAAKQVALVQRVADTAPAPVRADARRFLAALQLAQRNPSVRNDPSITKPAHTASDNVNRYASQKCGFFNQQPGGM